MPFMSETGKLKIAKKNSKIAHKALRKDKVFLNV